MSNRFVPVICVLLAVALVPTYIHSYAGTTVSDGRTLASIPASLSQYEGTSSGRNATWGRRRFDTDDWIERIYRSRGDEVKLTVIRSYDPKSLYHHPELAVSYGPSWAQYEVARLEKRPDIPMHVLRTDANSRAVAVYALHYDDAFVEDPIGFQIRSAAELLFTGRKAMTLFFLTDESVPAGAGIDALPSIDVLLAAIDRFLESAGPAH